MARKREISGAQPEENWVSPKWDIDMHTVCGFTAILFSEMWLKTATFGVLRLLQGNYDEAQKYLEEAQQQGIEQAEKNLEILQRMRMIK